MSFSETEFWPVFKGHRDASQASFPSVGETTTTCAGSNRIFGEVDDSKLHTKLKYCQLCIHPGLNDQEPRANPSAACMSCIVDLEERRNEKERGVVTDSSAKKRKRMPRRKPRTQNK